MPSGRSLIVGECVTHSVTFHIIYYDHLWEVNAIDVVGQNISVMTDSWFRFSGVQLTAMGIDHFDQCNILLYKEWKQPKKKKKKKDYWSITGSFSTKFILSNARDKPVCYST